MNRPPRDPRPAAAAPRAARDVRSPLLTGAPVAVVLSLIGLVIVALGTAAVSSGNIPLPGGAGRGPGSSGGTNVGPGHSATPSGVVVVPTEPPGVKVPGTFVYAKAGNIWLQSDGKATQLTDGGTDSMPSFTPDGQNVLFIRTRSATLPGRTCSTGAIATYHMDIPSVMEVPVTGGSPKKLLDGAYNPPGPTQWMAWIREPVLSPNGHTLAIATDLPDPTKCPTADVTIKFYDTSSHKLSDPKLADMYPLGHQDPAWRPDGKALAYVYNNRDGANGAPQIYVYANGRGKPISGPGYLHPAWSPDGQYLAVTKTSSYGTDIAILNASTGAEVSRLTNDGSSWAPVWSPAGDQIAFLHIDGQVVDLRLVRLTGTYGAWTAGDTIDLTASAGLDSVSRPGWFIPPDQIPAATPAGGSPGAGSGSPSGSSAAPSPS